MDKYNCRIKIGKEFFGEIEKIWCKFDKEDNDFFYSQCHKKSVMIDKINRIIYLEKRLDICDLEKYVNYVNDFTKKKHTRIVLLTLSPETHRTSEENLGLAYLAAVLRRNGFFVNIIDGWLENLNEQQIYEKVLKLEKIAIVGISCYMSNNDKSIYLAKKIRERKANIKIICGGFGPSFNVEKFLEGQVFDYVMIGEGERSIVNLCNYILGYKELHREKIAGIAYLKDLKVIRNEKIELIGKLDNIPFAARDMMHIAVDRKSTVNVLTARGCKGNCLFCSINAFNKLCVGSKWRGRTIKNIVDELQLLQSMGAQYIKFVDDSFLEDERDVDWVKAFRDEIVRRKIDVSLRGSLKADQVTELKIRYLKEAGFRSFACGIENGSETALKRMNKSASLNDNKKALNLMKKYGIHVQAGFILFDDKTTFLELKENYDFLCEFDWIITKGIFSEMFAANGTLYTELLIKENKIKKNDIYDNNKYDIDNISVKMAYYALKKWHKSHMEIYDMIVDPLSSPKAISIDAESSFYQLYVKLKKKDLEFMGEVLRKIEKGIEYDNLKCYVEDYIKNNKEFYCLKAKEGNDLCSNYEIIYDASKNPFI